MEVKVRLQAVSIKDENTGEVFSLKTIRSARDIADYIQESEKDEVVSKLEQQVWEILNQKEQ